MTNETAKWWKIWKLNAGLPVHAQLRGKKMPTHVYITHYKYKSENNIKSNFFLGGVCAVCHKKLENNGQRKMSS